MSRLWVTRGLIATVVLQLFVLGMVYVNSVYPLWVGHEIRLKVVPVDPRSLFRGNYARLRYEISRVGFTGAGRLRKGEIVYIKLKKGNDGMYHYEALSTSKPDAGVFIRGRIRNIESPGAVSVKYGIEAFFASRKKALALETRLAKGAIAIVKVADNGKAALLKVLPK